jgi:hypothetical protein
MAILLLVLGTLPGSACWAEWKAGAGKVQITPPANMWMAGYAARDHAAVGTLADLWVRALVLEDGGGHRAALVTLDLIGLDRALSTTICQQLNDRFDLNRDQISLCASHTHSGPVVGQNLAPMHYRMLDANQQRMIDAYAQALPGKICSAVQQALEQLEPSQISWGNGRATFAVNRRNNPAGNVLQRRSEASLQGPHDHDVPVLAVHDQQGNLKAVAFGYACHATVLMNYEWNGDYPGFAQSELEETHPGCVALYWAGCGGDQNPLPRRSVALAKHYGTRLAAAVDTVLLTTAMEAVSDHLRTDYQEIDLAFDRLPKREKLNIDAQSEDRYVASRARWLLEQIDSGKPLSPNYPYPIAVWQLGDGVQWVFLGGEVVVDFALRLKSEFSADRTWVAAYANDVMAYIPSRRILREGGYEGASAMVYYGLPTTWTPDAEEAIVRSVHSSLRAEAK